MELLCARSSAYQHCYCLENDKGKARRATQYDDVMVLLLPCRPTPLSPLCSAHWGFRLALMALAAGSAPGGAIHQGWRATPGLAGNAAVAGRNGHQGWLPQICSMRPPQQLQQAQELLRVQQSATDLSLTSRAAGRQQQSA
jgi:hypothetical protein